MEDGSYEVAAAAAAASVLVAAASPCLGSTHWMKSTVGSSPQG